VSETKPEPPSLETRLRQHAHELVNGGTNASELRSSLEEAAETIVSLHQQLAKQGWRPIDTAPRDGTPFLICWASVRRGERVPRVEMVGGWHEYEECRSYGEPEAYGWHPLPRPLSSPMTAATDQESGR
jgi:hypothetical protein